MYCRKCGALIKENVKYCPDCGTQVVRIEQKTKSEKETGQDLEAKRRAKHPNEKNPYIMAAMIPTFIALLLAVFPWNLIGKGIGTSFAMRIIIVVLSLLGDYHVTKAKQVNNLLFSKYGFRIKASSVKVISGVAMFVTAVSLFSLFMI